MGEMLFKGVCLQPIDKLSPGDLIHSTVITDNKTITNIKLAKRKDFNCSQHYKKCLSCDAIKGLASATMTIILRYTCIKSIRCIS